MVGAGAMALGEIAGDKWRHAPDRIVAVGMAARLLTGAMAGAAVAPRAERRRAAALGAAAAIVAAYASFALRRRAARRIGQVRSGVIEDALAVGTAAALIAGARRG